MSSRASGSEDSRHEPQVRRHLPVLKIVSKFFKSTLSRKVRKSSAANQPQLDQAIIEAAIKENLRKASSTSPDLMRDGEDGSASRASSRAARQQFASGSQARVARGADTPTPSPTYLEVPQRFAGFTPYPSPTSSRSGSPDRFPNGAPVFRHTESPVPSTSSASARNPSSLQEYHFDAAHYHNESAAYHDNVSEYFDSAAEYHDNAVEYHDSKARFHRVQFHSPVASFFPSSSESLLEPLLTPIMPKSVAGSIHDSPDLQGAEDRFSTSSTLRPSSVMSATDPKLTSVPTAPELALPVAEGSSTSETAPTDRPIKWIIRAKTPSFSSDSEAEFYNGPSVFMNADKGWEPDVKKVKKKSKARSSRQGSSSSTASTVKLAAGPTPGSSLQVPSFEAGGTHSRSSSSVSGLSHVTAASTGTGCSGTTGFLDQDELMTRMLNPEQQVRNAENHVKAMKEALAKAFKDREAAEDRTAVAEAQLKASLGLQTNERGESVLMEKHRVTEEKLHISQALLEKARERNAEYEDRTFRAERLVQKMADKVKVGVPAIVNSANAEVAEIQTRLDKATERAEKAELRLKEANTVLEGNVTQSYKDALEVAEKRAQTAEELQEKDRLWTVDADERAVHAEQRATELHAELIHSQNIIADHHVLVSSARSRAEKAEKEAKDAESELEAFENRAIEFEKEAYEFKTKFTSLKKYTDRLQEHHNAREKEYMACNEEWQSREDDFIKQTTDLKRWGDEGAAQAQSEIQKLQEASQEAAHDKQLIIATFSNALAKMKDAGKAMMTQDEIDRLVDWAGRSPTSKKGKEPAGSQSIAVVREKARRTLEGLAFTPSLDAVEDQPRTFEGPAMEGVLKISPTTTTTSATGSSSSNIVAAAPSVPTVVVNSQAKSRKSEEDDEAFLRKHLAAMQKDEGGVQRLPGMSKLAWYGMNKTPK